MSITVRQLLAAATRTLRDLSPTPRLDAELLLALVLGWERARLAADYDHTPDQTQVDAFYHLLERRTRKEPVAYLVGSREFYGLSLLVDQRVLIPRPETELLVDLALRYIAEQQAKLVPDTRSSPLLVADVGTGSGAIAIALAARVRGVHIYATDVSQDALDVAALNCERHHVTNQVTLVPGDLLHPLPEQVNLVVSNPPYTIVDEIDQGVRLYEPSCALDGGADGLDAYRRLVAQLPRALLPGGAVLLEIGAMQAEGVSTLIRAAFPLASLSIHRDLAGHDRVVAAYTSVDAAG